MPLFPLNKAKDKGGRKRPPVIAHPAFPAVVALWLAALMGVGMFILPIQLLERIVGATGIAAIVPAAAPPLGFTARAAIALAAALVGALLGFFAARMLAQKAPLSLPPIIDDEEAPYSETGEEVFAEDNAEYIAQEINDPAQPDALAPTHGRRRALTLPEVDAPGAPLAAPLPGADGEGDDTLDYTDFSAMPDAAQVWSEALYDEAEDEKSGVSAEALAATDDAPLVEEASWSDETEEPASPLRAPDTGDTNPHETDLVETPHSCTEEPGHVGQFADAPLEFSPPSLFRQTGMDNPQDEPVEAAQAAENSAEAEVETDILQLAQKLIETLEKHRSWSVRRAASNQAPSAEQGKAAAEPVDEKTGIAPRTGEGPLNFDAAPADDAEEAMATYFGGPPVIAPEDNSQSEIKVTSAPAVDQPGEAAPTENLDRMAELGRVAALEDGDEDYSDDLGEIAASFSLPLGKAAKRRDIGYGVLATAQNPYRPAAALHEMQHAEDKQERSNKDSERALRDALLNLQRMGK